MANCCAEEDFRDDDRAPTKYISVFEIVKDWLCSVQASGLVQGTFDRPQNAGAVSK